MKSGEEMDNLIKEWKFLHLKGDLKRHGKKPRIKELRGELFKLMGDQEIMILPEYVLQKQHHEKYSTVAVWDKKTWNEAEQRRNEWSQNNLDWIK